MFGNSCLGVIRSSHLYLYNAFNNTNCNRCLGTVARVLVGVWEQLLGVLVGVWEKLLGCY